MQEQYCIKKYGEVYIEYMKETPRILFIKGKNYTGGIPGNFQKLKIAVNDNKRISINLIRI
jgi:hypothetical protein